MSIKSFEGNEKKMTYLELLNKQKKIKEEQEKELEDSINQKVDKQYQSLVDVEVEDFQIWIKCHSPVKIEMVKSMYSNIKIEIDDFFKKFKAHKILKKNHKELKEKFYNICVKNMVRFMNNDEDYVDEEKIKERETKVKEFKPTKEFVEKLMQIFSPKIKYKNKLNIR